MTIAHLPELATNIFFFQAEDGIRDYKVTGVQTCALPIYRDVVADVPPLAGGRQHEHAVLVPQADGGPDRKSTRLNSSHLVISYAVFCLKKKRNYRRAEANQ